MTATKSSRTIEPIPPGYVLLKHIEPQPGGAPPKTEQVIVSKKPVNGLAGDIVKSAMVVRGNLGEPQIEFTLTDDGAKKFAETTRENVGHRHGHCVGRRIVFRAEHPKPD